MVRVVLIIVISFIFFVLGLFFSSTFLVPYFSDDNKQMIATARPTPTMALATATPTPTIIPSPTATPTPTKPLPVPTVAVKSEVRIMPLGDSITYGIGFSGSYRTALWKKLIADGDRINFVGSVSHGSGDLGDSDNEGHIGWEIGQLDANVIGWIAAYQPDIVLLHIGSNDIDHGVPADVMISRLSSLLNHIFIAKPTTYVIVSTLIPINRGDQATWVAFNAAIPGIVAQFRSQGYKIVSVNMSNALTFDDLRDGLHPDKAGYGKMATQWYPVVSTVYREYANAYGIK